MSPSDIGRSSLPHSWQCEGITNSRSVPSRRSSTGPRISGITSPALRSTTVSPSSTPLALTICWLCSVAYWTIEPATLTGSAITAYGVARPVRPMPILIEASLAVTSSGGYFQAMAQRGDLEVAPSRPCSAISSTLTTTPSISCSTECRCSPYCLMNARTSSRVATTRLCRAVGRPQSCSSWYACDWQSMSKPTRAPMPCTTMCSGREAVTSGSFIRSEPAAALRGLANSLTSECGRLPSLARSSFSARRRSFSAANEAFSSAKASVGR